jgi:hypothetical protein
MPMIFEMGPEDNIPLQSSRDLNGTPVEDAEGLPIGAVFGALAEADTGLLRYLDLALTEEPRHVLVPIGHTRVAHRRGRLRVKLKAANRSDLSEIPSFDSEAEPLGDGFEHDLLEAFSRVYYGERYYAHPAYDHSSLYAGEHPIHHEGEPPVPEAAPPAPPAEEDAATTRLRPLGRLEGYRVAPGEPDIRGWTVVSDGRAPIGRVEELIVDPDAGKVRYVAVATDDPEPAPVLLPIGFLELHTEEHTVQAPALDAAALASLPRHDPERPLDRAQEDALRSALARCTAGARRFRRPDFRAAPPDDEDQVA